MARLNTRPSDHPVSRYASQTPAPGDASDRENHNPDTRKSMDKGKRRASDTSRRDSGSMPTPDQNSDRRGQKRKRMGALPNATRPDFDVHGDEEVEADVAEARFNRFFDPNQRPEERREIKRKSRALERHFQETRDDVLRNNSGNALTDTIRRANTIYKDVKQTNDATLDSRLLVSVSDLANKKITQLVLGDASTGVDVDEFLSKCITYMRNGGPLNRDDGAAPPTSQRRRSHNYDISEDEDDYDTGDGTLDWAFLGHHACFPYNSRPPVPSFLLGPLSVEKKQRSQTQRRARNAGDSERERRPEELSKENFNQAEENGLTAICTRIRSHLNAHIRRTEKIFSQAGFTSAADLHTPRGLALMQEHHVTDTGSPSLFEYVINPHSFGQTVENLFYVSFLIKEGSLGILPDSRSMPTLACTVPHSLDQQRKEKISKHQAVFSLDYATWERLVEAFNIKEPMIPHREEEESATQIGQRGWYA